MRKVVAWELVSLDGVVEAPEEWAFSYSNDEMEEANASGMAASDAMLLGRATYEGLAAFWPHQPAGTPMVDYINSVPKFVVSTTLKEPLEWNNSTLIKGNVAEEIAKLKRRPGKDITALGSGALVQSLLREDLLEELRLIVHPLELPPIGWQLFILGSSQSDSTAFPSLLDTYATRLLAEPLSLLLRFLGRSFRSEEHTSELQSRQ